MTDTPSLRRSFRLVCNPGQIPSVEALLSAQGFVFEPEPFSPLARRLLQEPFPLGRSLAAFWGYVYIQDRSSMLPPLALAPGEGARVLDMCASPGSKTGLLAQLVGREGLVLGNEPARPRLANLRRNLAALNLLQAVTCSWPGESLPLPDASWDAVLLDPPCSGWGTTDKNPQAIKRWQGDRLKPMLDLQRKLLTEASRLLRPGGKLVYSTCTTNVDENEGQVRFAVEGLGLEPIPLEPFPGFVFAAPELPGCEGTLRVDEDASNAQGFYIALLRKPGDSVAVPGLARGTAATAAYRAIPPAFLAEFGLSPALLPPGDLAVFEDSLHFLPAPALAHLPAAVRWQGMALGKASAQGLIPSARLRALLDPEPQRIPRLDVDDVPILERLLQGGSLEASEEQFKAIQEEMATAERKATELANQTIDLIFPGEQQPESDHGIQYEQAETGTNKDRHFRRAKGWFGYQLKVKEEASRLLITVRKDDRNKVAILLNNEKLAVHPTVSEADKDGFITLSYVLPQKLNTGSCLIRFIPDGTEWTSAVYEVRLLK